MIQLYNHLGHVQALQVKENLWHIRVCSTNSPVLQTRDFQWSALKSVANQTNTLSNNFCAALALRGERGGTMTLIKF